MSRRQCFGGLFSFILGVTFILLCRAGSRAHASHGAQHGDFQAQGKICLHVDIQREFDRTVRAVKGVLNFNDQSQQAKLNYTIYKGLMNHVISQSLYPTEIQDELPKADDSVVKELEEAGFVVLANLAKKDFSVTIVTNNNDGMVSLRHIKPCTGSSSQLKNNEASVTPPCDKYSPHVEGDNQHSDSSKKHCDLSSREQTQSYKTSHIGGDRTKLTPIKPVLKKLTTSQQDPLKKRRADHTNRNPNPFFERGKTSSPSLQTSSTQSGDLHVTKPSHQMRQDSLGNVDSGRRLVNVENLTIVEDDLYWSAAIEAATPKGFSQQEIDEWKDRLSKQSVRSFEPGDLDKCGRKQNRFIVLEDGSKVCARYRYPMITSMTGEIYSYHLARMLGLTNLPPLHLSVATTTNGSFWRGQGSNFQDAEWEDGKVVVLTKWIEDLGDAFFPETLVRGPFPVVAQNHGLRNLTMKELTVVLQWSDLILFDYLIAHFDRLTINLSGVRYYNDTSLMRSQVHNLVQHPHTKQLWIVDNESGLLDGYSFLLVEGNNDSIELGEFHEELLHKICIFRRSTVERVRALLGHPNPAKLLTERVLKEDPSSEGVFPAIDRIQGHSAILKERLEKIQRWIQECEKRNVGNSAL